MGEGRSQGGSIGLEKGGNREEKGGIVGGERREEGRREEGRRGGGREGGEEGGREERRRDVVRDKGVIPT